MDSSRLSHTRVPQPNLTPTGDLRKANEERRLLYEALYALRHDGDAAAVHYADYLLARCKLTTAGQSARNAEVMA